MVYLRICTRAVGLVAKFASDKTLLYIWDGPLPPKIEYRGERPFIVLSSPNDDNFHHFTKGPATTYYMDTWTLHDILKALPLFPGVGEDVARERYSQFGGTVRSVLAQALDPSCTFDKLVAQAIAGGDMNFICSLSHQGTSADMKHRWVHIRAGPDMLSQKLVVASPLIRRLAYQTNVELQKFTMRTLFLVGAAGISAIAGFRGQMLEEVGHEQLRVVRTVTLLPAKRPSWQEAIEAARNAAEQAATSVEAGVAIRAAAAMERQGDSPAFRGISKLRRSKRRRLADAQEEVDVQQLELLHELEEEGEDRHALPPLAEPLPDSQPTPAAVSAEAEGVHQQVAGMHLDSGNEKVQLHAVPRVWDYPGRDIKHLTEYYLQPTTINNAAWDAVRKCSEHLWILQYTISKWHGTKAQPILDLLDRFSDEDKDRAILVYGVPPELCPGYLQQPWLTVGRKLMERIPDSLVRMRQKVLQMPTGDVGSKGSSAGGSS